MSGHLVKILTINGGGMKSYRPVCSCRKWEGVTTEHRASAEQQAKSHGVIATVVNS